MKKTVASLPPGTQIMPGLRVLGLLGRGSAMETYDVWSEERDCRCVVKTMRPDRKNRKIRDELLFEGRLLLNLAHPHFVRAYELHEKERPVLVLETLTGATLGRLLQRRPLPPRDVVILGRQLCSAVGYLHQKGVLHLDLKPDNVVAQAGVAKVIDLSIARPPGRGRRGVGTPAYMAPEQMRGKELSSATDVWGIGAVLFEALTGRLPRHGFARASAKSPLRLRVGPAPLRHAVEACLARRPGARPTVAELGDVLKSVA